MIYPSNLHTHTTYCDGKDSIKQMINAALQKNYVSLGFSGHAPLPFAQSWCMSKETNLAYLQELMLAQAEYAGRLEILIGVEQDYFSVPPLTDYDFIIGAVHYVLADGVYLDVDDSPQAIRTAVREHFGGNPYHFAAAYYELMADVVRKTCADVIGHFDLLVKFNEHDRLWDENDPRYRRVAFDALAELVRMGKPFEINTGAAYRGWRREFYPSLALLTELHRLGGKIVFSSDSHDAFSLGYSFSEAAEAARSCGFCSALLRRVDGWHEIAL